MVGSRQAVTFDFHNTIARCDEWFKLEVRELLPAFLDWYHKTEPGNTIQIAPGEAVDAYRKLRIDIMGHGLEKDAATCVDIVLQEFGYAINPDVIDRGVEEVMLATLPDSNASPGIVESVVALHQRGIPLGVVSSAAYHPFLEWSLDKFRIGNAFANVVTSASCGYYKSRTEIYEIAIASLDACPERSVHIGDSERFDVMTAKRAGMATILYDPNGEAGAGSEADVVVQTLHGIDKDIERLLEERST
jgi:FMN phosphatase YigB (HAD superfamily)